MQLSTGEFGKLRILHITEAYPPDYGGGISIYVRDVCQFLARHGHELSVFSVDNTDEPEYATRTESDGPVRVTRVNLPYIAGHDPEGWKLGLRRWRAHQQRLVRIINDLLEDEKPDLVHCHGMRLFGEECVIDIQRRGIPLVWMLHDSWPICIRRDLMRSPTNARCPGPAPLRCVECIYSNNDGSHMRAWFKFPWRLAKLGSLPAYRVWRRRVASRCGRGAIGVSDFIARTHQPYLPGLVEHIPLGIDLSGVPDHLPMPPRTLLRFGFVGGFAPHKGIWDVLNAIASLLRRGFDCELHIWGLGAENQVWGHNPEKSRSEIEARGISHRVFLHGLYLPEDTWQIYSSIDVAIMATTVPEAFGRVPKEAAAVGVPTIAPDAGGISEQIRHGVDGLLYRFRDPADLEHQMERVLSDPSLVNQFAANLKRPRDTQEATSSVEDFYYRVLEREPAWHPVEALANE